MASSQDLPCDYDAIILGTGMTECIVAAALSRIGYNVLHLDRNDYYSGDWACFNWKGLQDWIETKQSNEKGKLVSKQTDLAALLKDGEQALALQINSSTVTNVKQTAFISAKPEIADVASSDPDTASTNTTGKETENLDVSGEVNEKSENESSDADQNKEKTSEELPADNENCNVEQNTMETGNESEITQESDMKTDESQTAESSTSKSDRDDEEKVASSSQSLACKQKDQYYLDDISSQWRKFNLDLMPKVLYCRGAMVELLISSDVAKYCEFKTISRVLTFTNNKLEPVPCSRSDVFSSKQVSMIEKRMMMKFLQFCMNYSEQPEEYEGCEEMAFCEYLKSKKKLTANVCHYIQHAIAMVNDRTKTVEGLESCKRFLQSLGRYGNTAFLWPVYGSGELPQCFCRMCAVFGGCYCLRRTGTQLVVNAENKCTGIVDTEGQRLNCNWLIMESSYAPAQYRENAPVKKASRAILVTNHSILRTPNQEDITQLSYPREGDNTPITLYEVGPSAYACPKDMFVVHLTCACENKAEKDFEEIVTKLFRPTSEDNVDEEDPRPSILWQLYFEVEDSNGIEYKECPSGVHIVPGPDSKMDFEDSIKKAKEIFTILCPGEEFLPKAPNPEDIIWDEGDQNKATKESGFETESNIPDSNIETESSGVTEDVTQTDTEVNSSDIADGNETNNLQSGENSVEKGPEQS